MKFIIKQDKLHNIIYKFLDSNINLFEGDDGWYGDSDSENYVLFYHSRWTTLYVSFDLINRISDFFNLSYSDSKIILTKWFEQKTGETTRETKGATVTSLLLKK